MPPLAAVGFSMFNGYRSYLNENTLDKWIQNYWAAILWLTSALGDLGGHVWQWFCMVNHEIDCYWPWFIQTVDYLQLDWT